MLSKYAKESMPEGITPFRLSLYPDEKKIKEEEDAKKLEKEAGERKADS